MAAVSHSPMEGRHPLMVGGQGRSLAPALISPLIDDSAVRAEDSRPVMSSETVRASLGHDRSFEAMARVLLASGFCLIAVLLMVTAAFG